VDYARRPDMRSWPHRSFIVALALGLGLLLGVVAALSADVLERMRADQVVSEQLALLKFYAGYKEDVGKSSGP